MQSNSSVVGANAKYAIIREHPDGHIEFKSSLSTHLGRWSPDLIYAYLDSDPAQLKAALTKEKKKLEKIRQGLTKSYLFNDDASIPYKYYLITVQLDYNINNAYPL